MMIIWLKKASITFIMSFIVFNNMGQTTDPFQQKLLELQQLEKTEEFQVFFPQLLRDWKELPLESLTMQSNQLIDHSQKNLLKEIWVHRIYAKALDDYHGKFNLALKQYNIYLEKAKAFDNGRKHSDALLQFGNFYYRNHFYLKALNYYYQAIDYSIERKESKKLTGRCYYIVGTINYKVFNYQQSIEDLKKYVEIISQEEKMANADTFELMDAYNTLGLSYQRINKYEKSIEEFNNSLTLAIQSKNEFWVGLISGNMGASYLRLKEYEKAEIFLLKQLEINTFLQKFTGDVYLDLIDLYLELDNMKMAERYLDSLNSPYTERNVQWTFKNLRQEGKIALIKGEYQNAALLFMDAMEKRDSLYSKEEAEILSRIKVMSEIVRFQKETEELTKQNLAQKEELNKQKLNNTIGLLLLVFFFLVGFIFFIAYSRSKIQRIKIQEQSIQLTQKGNEINQQNTALVKALKNLEETKSQLVHSEKMASIGIFTAGIAHELNNPINFINSGVVGLKKSVHFLLQIITMYEEVNENNFIKKLKKIDDFKNENKFNPIIELLKKIPDNIEFGVKRTNQIIEGLNKFSRKDSGKMVPYDINKGIEDNLMLASNLMEGRIEVIRNFKEIPIIQAYEGNLNHVFMNIILNAIQAILENGKILISTGILENYVFISIKDSGNGMTSKVKDQIFVPFYTTKEVGQGTGLGLFIAHEIVLGHNGKIEVESKVGKGTEFIIYLPIEP